VRPRTRRTSCPLGPTRERWTCPTRSRLERPPPAAPRRPLRGARITRRTVSTLSPGHDPPGAPIARPVHPPAPIDCAGHSPIKRGRSSRPIGGALRIPRLRAIRNRGPAGPVVGPTSIREVRRTSSSRSKSPPRPASADVASLLSNGCRSRVGRGWQDERPPSGRGGWPVEVEDSRTLVRAASGDEC